MSDALRCGVWSVEEVRRIAGSCEVLHKADWSTVNRRSGAKKSKAKLEEVVGEDWSGELSNNDGYLDARSGRFPVAR